MPIAGATFTSGYGMRWGRMHLGDDFATPSGRRSRRCRTGTVTFAGPESGYGNKVEIEYWDGTVSYTPTWTASASRWASRSPPVMSWGPSGNTGTRPGRTCTSRSTRHGGGPSIPPPGFGTTACSSAAQPAPSADRVQRPDG